MMARVYRLEAGDGQGPYNSRLVDYDYRSAMSMRHAWDARHLTPVRDGLDFPRMDEFCAFASMTDLFRWFGGYIKPLMAQGVQVAIYETTDSNIRYGGSQVLFRKSASKKVN